MPFQPNPHDTLTLDGMPYRIAEHPAAPGMPHGQEGRAGIVYRPEQAQTLTQGIAQWLAA